MSALPHRLIPGSGTLALFHNRGQFRLGNGVLVLVVNQACEFREFLRTWVIERSLSLAGTAHDRRSLIALGRPPSISRTGVPGSTLSPEFPWARQLVRGVLATPSQVVRKVRLPCGAEPACNCGPRKGQTAGFGNQVQVRPHRRFNSTPVNSNWKSFCAHRSDYSGSLSYGARSPPTRSASETITAGILAGASG